MNIEERVDRLEKQNRNLRRGLVGLLFLLLVVPLTAFMWQHKQSKVAKFDTIEARIVNVKRAVLVGNGFNSMISIEATENQAGSHSGVATIRSGVSLHGNILPRISVAGCALERDRHLANVSRLTPVSYAF